jgi:hypothetical protein
MGGKDQIENRAHYKTRNCVVCGKVLDRTVENPSCFSGHVLIDNTIQVCAGACYNNKCDIEKDKWKSVNGCFGKWKPKYGVVQDRY